ncbi:MAG: pseudouridine synthase [Alphaproteobacteria bacterium RIFCSPHIGHO2_02_FULL_46_13]|nr:MAG: pseudouridine synthase [Alphaproteobacteria bacterium RIFCSPHIGHO2_02_FULL_46_13]
MTDVKDKDDDNSERGDRIAKVLARLGVASRRDAEKLIAERRVVLNGETVLTPATFVKEGDRLEVDGEKLGRQQKTRLFLYHKPPGLITTAKDPEGRTTVFETLPSNLPRLISVGRLDLNTEGLLLLTNDGELSRALELPSTGLKRTYRVRVYGDYGGEDVLAKKLEKLKKGLFYKGVRYGSIDASLDEQQKMDGHNYWITMTLTEGKNREIRNVLEAIGYRVSRLIRVAYGPFELEDMNREEIVEVPIKAMRELLPEDVAKKITGG